MGNSNSTAQPEEREIWDNESFAQTEELDELQDVYETDESLPIEELEDIYEPDENLPAEELEDIYESDNSYPVEGSLPATPRRNSDEQLKLASRNADLNSPKSGRASYDSPRSSRYDLFDDDDDDNVNFNDPVTVSLSNYYDPRAVKQRYEAAIKLSPRSVKNQYNNDLLKYRTGRRLRIPSVYTYSKYPTVAGKGSPKRSEYVDEDLTDLYNIDRHTGSEHAPGAHDESDESDDSEGHVHESPTAATRKRNRKAAKVSPRSLKTKYNSELGGSKTGKRQHSPIVYTNNELSELPPLPWKEVEVDQNDYVPEDLVGIYDIDPATGRNYTPVQSDPPAADNGAHTTITEGSIVDRIIQARASQEDGHWDDIYFDQFHLLEAEGYGPSVSWRLISNFAEEENNNRKSVEKRVESIIADTSGELLSFSNHQWEGAVLAKQGSKLVRDQGKELYWKGFDNEFLETVVTELEKEDPRRKKDSSLMRDALSAALDGVHPYEWLSKWAPRLRQLGYPQSGGKSKSSSYPKPIVADSIISRVIEAKLTQNDTRWDDIYFDQLRLLGANGFGPAEAWRVIANFAEEEIDDPRVVEERVQSLINDRDELVRLFQHWEKSVLVKQGSKLVREQGQNYFRMGFDNTFLEAVAVELEKENPRRKKDSDLMWNALYATLSKIDPYEWLFLWAPRLRELWTMPGEKGKYVFTASTPSMHHQRKTVKVVSPAEEWFPPSGRTDWTSPPPFRGRSDPLSPPSGWSGPNASDSSRNSGSVSYSTPSGSPRSPGARSSPRSPASPRTHSTPSYHPSTPPAYGSRSPSARSPSVPYSTPSASPRSPGIRSSPTPRSPASSKAPSTPSYHPSPPPAYGSRSPSVRSPSVSWPSQFPSSPTPASIPSPSYRSPRYSHNSSRPSSSHYSPGGTPRSPIQRLSPSIRSPSIRASSIRSPDIEPPLTPRSPIHRLAPSILSPTLQAPTPTDALTPTNAEFDRQFTEGRPGSRRPKSAFKDHRVKKVEPLRYSNKLYGPRRLPNTPTKSHLPPSPRWRGPKTHSCETCGRAFKKPGVKKAKVAASTPSRTTTTGTGRVRAAATPKGVQKVAVTPRRSPRSTTKPARYAHL